ncbi:chromatin assembly factor 1 subunit A-domain-containing protein [Mrakia frigida]|uniref:RLF2 family protein n=1 Tax=Mrakia frigida TaxID=29902 RepID=UPI003FCC1115
MDSDSIMLDADTNQEQPSPAQPTASSSKRKANELTENSSSDDIVCLSDKKPKSEPTASSSTIPASTLVKLQGSKLIVSQKSGTHLLQGATSSLKELLDWKVFIGESENAALLKDGIPDRFWGLVVKQCHESEKTLPNLAKQLRNELLPATTTADDVASSSTSSPYDALSTSNLELLIATLLKRANYGLTAEDMGLTPEAKIPAGLGIWRWEAKSRAMYLPSESLGALEARFREREQAKQACITLWQNLTTSQRTDVLSSAKSSKGKEKAAPAANIEVVVLLDDTDEGSSPVKKPKKEPKDGEETVKKVKKEKEKVVDPVKEARLAEKAQKEQEKADRKTAREARAKEKEDKERKEKEVKQRSAAAMFSFFKKPSEPSRKSPALKSEAASMSDFDRTFLPFVEKKGVERAPVNRFLLLKNKKLEKGKSKSSNQASTSKLADAMDLDVESMTPADLLASFLKTIPASRLPVRAKYSSPAIKSGPIYQSVRDVIARSQDAEISGNGDPHKITEELKDGHLFKRKLLQFREDTRPAYFGTWTQTSTTIGPRTPFAQDAGHFDYGYDSGCDWEEDDGDGDDIESLSGKSPKKKKSSNAAGGSSTAGGGMWDTDDEDESFDEDEDDSDGSADGWMVSEDEGGGVAEGKRSQSPAMGPGGVAGPGGEEKEVTFLSVKKGKGKEKEKEQSAKKKKTVMVPVVKGPFFEITLGVCGWDGFEGYRIQMLNDAPANLDPFTFVAAPPLLPASNSNSNGAPIIGLGTPNSHLSSVPRRISEMLPPSIIPSNSTPSSSRSNSLSTGSTSTTATNASSFVVDDSSTTASPAASSSAATAKYVPKPFPSAHLPRFLDYVGQSTRPSLLLVAELQEVFAGCGIRKGQFEFELKKRCKRESKKDGAPWIILNRDP